MLCLIPGRLKGITNENGEQTLHTACSMTVVNGDG
jgi:hypothetical protein